MGKPHWFWGHGDRGRPYQSRVFGQPAFGSRRPGLADKLLYAGLGALLKAALGKPTRRRKRR